MRVIFGIILLGVIVFIHEMGHFIASKLCKVKVESFSIGMGPILLHKKIFDTDWRISLLPFGGYCGMKGEKDFDNEFSLNEPDSFYGKKPIFRAIIGSAGPIANFLFAIISFTSISMIGYSYYSSEPIIQISTEIYPESHSPAFDSGIRTGDRVIQINDEKIIEFSDISRVVSKLPNKDLIVQIERKNQNHKILTFTVHSDSIEDENGIKIGKIGVVSTKIDSEKLNFPSAIIKGTKETFLTTKLYVEGFFSLFKSNISQISESVSGPARITTMLGDSVKYGFVAILNFMAIINIALFFMNLLPIPILDGWLVLISIVETIIKKRVSKKIKTIAQIIGISLIILLFLIATASDIKYFLGL